MLEQIIKLIEDTDGGNAEILETFVTLREKKETLDYLLAKIKDFEKRYITEITNDAMDYPEGYKGYNITLVNGKQTYSYKNINEWAETEKLKKELEKKYKSLFQVYQNTNERPMSEDGEVYDLPEVNYSASYFKVTKVKKK